MPDPIGSERDMELGNAPDVTRIASDKGMRVLITRLHEKSQTLAAALAGMQCGTKPPLSLSMAELCPVEQIMADPGLPGTLEYALVQAGIPGLTVMRLSPTSLRRR